jgi:galactose-1-phosphate uridylyltransferase
MAYNGWKNYETWNVALWMFGDESIYNIVQTVATMEGEYHNFASIMFNDFEMETTPDGVTWDHPELDIIALNEALYEAIA